MDNILDTILKDTFTLIRFRHRLRVLKSYLLKAFFGGETEVLTPSPDDLKWLSTLPKEFFQIFTKDNIYQTIDELEKIADNLPALTVYLPVEATEGVCLQIGSYARRCFQNPKLILDTKYDPSLIAGPALVWKGMYKDYSLRSRINQRKEEIFEGFKKFLR